MSSASLFMAILDGVGLFFAFFLAGVVGACLFDIFNDD